MSNSKYSRLDTDEERLPENMTRIGYDADTSKYQYQDTTNGSYWEGSPGSRYGQLRPVGWVDPRSDEERIEAERSHDNVLREQEKEAWRYLLPFFMLCGVFLLGVWWVIGGRDFWATQRECGTAQYKIEIRAGDTCWSVAGEKGDVLEQLKHLNEGVDCDKLGVGDVLCLPGKQ